MICAGASQTIGIGTRHEVPLFLVMLPEDGAADRVAGDGLAVGQAVCIAVVGDAIEGGVKAAAGVEAEQREGIVGELAGVAQGDGAHTRGIVGDHRAVLALFGKDAGLEKEIADGSVVIEAHIAGDELDVGAGVGGAANGGGHDEVAIGGEGARRTGNCQARPHVGKPGGDIVSSVVAVLVFGEDVEFFGAAARTDRLRRSWRDRRKCWWRRRAKLPRVRFRWVRTGSNRPSRRRGRWRGCRPKERGSGWRRKIRCRAGRCPAWWGWRPCWTTGGRG